MMAGFELPIPVIRQYISSSIGLIVQISPSARRAAADHARLGNRGAAAAVRMSCATCTATARLGIQNGETVGEFYATGYEPTFLGRLKSQGLDLPASLFQDRVLHTD